MSGDESPCTMVEVESVSMLSERRKQTSSQSFPSDTLASIRSAVEQVPEDFFRNSSKNTEIGAFDAEIAEGLPEYEYEGDRAGGYNPNCKLWSHLGFNYSVDLYQPDERIAIEVEKKRAEKH